MTATVSGGVASTESGAARRFLLFGSIGLSGFIPNLACVFVLSTVLGLHYLIATLLATQVAIAWNFVLIERFVYRRVRAGPWYRRAVPFVALNNADLLLRIPLLAVLMERAHMNCIVATVVTLVAMFVVRFLVTDRFIYQLRGRCS